jgi:hypothetical protein
VVFDKGVGLDKMNHENENIPLLYIPMEDADYAIAMMDMNVNEIPVNFETNVMGEYTISLRQEDCEFEELYLLDKETNTTVNILAEDYTFIATSNDSPERFILMKDNGQQSLCISVSNAKYSDRAFVVFDKGVGLYKMNHENEDIPLLYIPMEDADYAIAMMDMNVNEIPVNFETNVMGEYTISLRQENCEFDELYLLDKETDEKVNILEQDYTFIATSSENPERFILMKDAQGSQLEAHSHFAYINNGDIVIYNIEGDADIKIFDALGRCVYQGESSDETTRIANGYSSGVYMIHKIDDNGVNVQKIIL